MQKRQDKLGLIVALAMLLLILLLVGCTQPQPKNEVSGIKETASATSAKAFSPPNEPTEKELQTQSQVEVKEETNSIQAIAANLIQELIIQKGQVKTSSQPVVFANDGQGRLDTYSIVMLTRENTPIERAEQICLHRGEFANETFFSQLGPEAIDFTGQMSQQRYVKAQIKGSCDEREALADSIMKQDKQIAEWFNEKYFVEDSESMCEAQCPKGKMCCFLALVNKGA